MFQKVVKYIYKCDYCGLTETCDEAVLATRDWVYLQTTTDSKDKPTVLATFCSFDHQNQSLRINKMGD